MIEKRFEQIKTVDEIAPVFLKNEGRIEALFTLYFLALLVQALTERELRLAMKCEKIAELPLYPEQRLCAHPTTEQILGLFRLAQRHRLTQNGRPVQVFGVSFTRPAASGARTARCPRAGIPAVKTADEIRAKLHSQPAECKFHEIVRRAISLCQADVDGVGVAAIVAEILVGR
jgi:hypothetical protein